VTHADPSLIADRGARGPMTDSAGSLLAEGRRVLRSEAASVGALKDRIGEEFVRGCRMIADASGRTVVCGISKSGHIVRKIAATLISTGTPATFPHAVEALHGDLGIVSRDDVAILVSKSGEGSELGSLTEHLVRLGVPLIAITGRVDSPLANDATVVLDCSVAEEARAMELAPTSSTTATLALGDALAMVVLRLKGFQENDFAALHPGGTLGTKLSVRVADVMISDEYRLLGESATMKESIAPLAGMRGTLPVVDEDRRITGVLTARDLTRLMERDPDFLDHVIEQIMTRNPKTARPNELGSAAVHRLEEHGIMALPVEDESGRLVGIAHLHDLMRSGAV
jgi:arabinose-5-phosphate isomerase